MPRLSVFSWEGNDIEDDYREKEYVRRVRQTKPIKYAKNLNITSEKKMMLAKKMMHSFFRPSVMLLDITPEAPDDQNPLQRCITQQTKRPSMQLHLRINAMSEKRELTQKELITNNLRKSLTSSFPYNSDDKHGLIVEHDGTHYWGTTSSDKSTRERIWLGNLQLCEFRPLQAPFVPDLIRLLVVSIEVYCRANTWSVFFESYKHLRQDAKRQALLLIQSYHDEDALEPIIEAMHVELKLATLRAFLAAFPVKPMHLSKAVLKQLIKHPLYDKFLRPNPQIKSLVRQIALPKTRTELDTLSFLMTHIIRAWEGAPNSVTGRTIIAEIYGPLLISFSERPIIIDRDINQNKTVEAALMEVILDVCDTPFWNHLSMLKINKAFKVKCKRMELGKEPRRSLPTSVIPLPSIGQLKEREVEHATKDSLFRWPVRSTEAISRDLLRARLAIELPSIKRSGVSQHRLKLLQTRSGYVKNAVKTRP